MTGTDHGDDGRAVLATSSGVLRRRLAEGLQRWCILEAVDRSELGRSVHDGRATVVFLDLALPGLSGLDGVPDIQRLNAAARIVVLASAPSERQAVLALVAGARGYCDRRIAPSLVSKAAEVVQGGEIWIGRHVVPHLLRKITSLSPIPVAAAPGRGLPTRFEFLGPREREIALLVGGGANNREIAGRLRITESTVKAHLTSVFRKLNVSDRLRLALLMSGQRQRLARGVRRSPPRRVTASPTNA